MNCFLNKILFQTLDGKFGDGKSEAQGKYSAKEGVRPSQARPQTNIQVTKKNIQTKNQIFRQFILITAWWQGRRGE